MADIQLNSVTLATETGGTVTLPSAVTGTGGLRSQQVFTGDGTWTKPSGITTVKVYVTGGGGGGGPTNTDDYSGGGGAGGTSIKIIDVTSISSVTVTIGAGSAGRADNATNVESAGNSSSFGSHCTAGGGYTAGGNWAIAGRGGVGSGGDINIYGGDGQGGNIDLTNTHVTSGTGGGSFWGQGGRGTSKSSAFGRAGHAPGSGGGGGAAATAQNGAAGIVVVEEYS